jgi:predicted dehydrogenase
VACILLGRRGAGPVVSIGLDYVARQRVRRYEVVGDEGTLVWDLAARQLTLTTQKETRTLASDAKDFDVGATYLVAMRAFLDAVEGGRPFSPDLADGLAACELAIRAKDALRAGEGR